MLECIIACERLCLSSVLSVAAIVYLFKPVSIRVRERENERVKYVLHYTACDLKNYWGWNNPQTPSNQWWGMAPFAPLHCTNMWHLNVVGLSNNSSVWMPLTRGRDCVLLCAFDLQIKLPSVYVDEIRTSQSNLLSITGSNFGSWVVEPREATVPLPFCCLTPNSDLLILITDIILHLVDALLVAWHTQTNNKLIILEG